MVSDALQQVPAKSLSGNPVWALKGSAADAVRVRLPPAMSGVAPPSIPPTGGLERFHAESRSAMVGGSRLSTYLGRHAPSAPVNLMK